MLKRTKVFRQKSLLLHSTIMPLIQYDKVPLSSLCLSCKQVSSSKEAHTGHRTVTGSNKLLPCQLVGKEYLVIADLSGYRCCESLRGTFFILYP